MTPKQKFFHVAEEADLGVDYTEPEVSFAAKIDVWAPEGKTFAGGCHVDCSVGALQGNLIAWRKATNILQKLIADGFDDCTDPDCAFCVHGD